jgi:HEAT repeats
MTARCRVPGAVCRVLDARRRVPGAGCRVLRAACWVLGALVLAATGAEAQTLQQRIDGVEAKGGVTWVEYRVPMVGGSRRMCCFDSGAPRGADCCGRCRLEGRDGVVLNNSNQPEPVAARIVVEPPSEMRVFARIENRSVTRLRIFSLDCDVDADGVAVTTLSGIVADDSVAWLAALIRSGGDPATIPALSALALHPGDAAGKVLIALARNDQRTRIRSQALFWLSQRAGDEALKTIGSAVSDDPEIEVKRRAVFALSQLPRDEGVPMLLDLARNHRLPEVRRQAMFWLGQSKDPRAIDFFEEILRR